MTSEMSTGDLLKPARDGLHLGLKVGDSIGPYRLLSVLGEGGFGVVYVAERREPIVQRVALKVIKPGMDTKAVIARFEQERQALAVMDHPNVAKVYDAGATSEGRPYFVMELVQGEPITKYCDRHNLTIRQRLELFIPVCEAVQHAHMKGIIHRDIKPSNILVMVRDGKPIPKVIDFGVAKAISHTLTEKTIFTEHGQLIGTPEYMSPEQAEMGAVDIDTRSDVYSLGVLLYELLTGATPFDSRELRSKGYDEIRRIIREVDPPKPSTRLTSLHDSSVQIARHRQAKIDDLVKELSRELDWIPLKAMRKDRTERYGTALDLSEDIHRYLNGRPLDAGPERRWYRARKFLVRNRRSVWASALILLLTLVTGISILIATEASREQERTHRSWELEQTLSRLSAIAQRSELPLLLGDDLHFITTLLEAAHEGSLESELVQSVLGAIVRIRPSAPVLQRRDDAQLELMVTAPVLDQRIHTLNIGILWHIRVMDNDGAVVDWHDWIWFGREGFKVGRARKWRETGEMTVHGYGQVRLVRWSRSEDAIRSQALSDEPLAPGRDFVPLSQWMHLPIAPLQVTVVDEYPETFPLAVEDRDQASLFREGISIRECWIDDSDVLGVDLHLPSSRFSIPLEVFVDFTSRECSSRHSVTATRKALLGGKRPAHPRGMITWGRTARIWFPVCGEGIAEIEKSERIRLHVESSHAVAMETALMAYLTIDSLILEAQCTRRSAPRLASGSN